MAEIQSENVIYESFHESTDKTYTWICVQIFVFIILEILDFYLVVVHRHDYF